MTPEILEEVQAWMVRSWLARKRRANWKPPVIALPPPVVEATPVEIPLPPVTKADRWLSMKDAMAYASVSRRTIHRWVERGKITIKRTPGGILRVRESDLLK